MPSRPASPPTHQPSSIPQIEANALLASFTDFLTVAVHSLLYHRNLYPPRTFLTARAYNLAVHQSRHPKVCAWIRDAAAAVRAQLHRGAARRVVLVVHGLQPALPVLERWVFDVEGFPAWGKAGDKFVTERRVEEPPESEDGPDGGGGGGGGADEKINWPDVHEALRGALSRLFHVAEGMERLPDGCTFTIALELRDEAEPPIGHPQAWIPSEAHLQPPTPGKPDQGASLGGASTKSIRSVRAAPLFFECWVEQGNSKERSGSPEQDP